VSAWVVLLYLIPKNLMSRAIGFLAQLNLPQTIRTFLFNRFVNYYKINMDEAELPFLCYRSFDALFTRRLQAGQRPIESHFVSPCDGTLSYAQESVANMALQVKGQTYSLKELVGLPEGDREQLAFFQTIYLAPHNYHGVHAPMSGKIESIEWIPGRLWPVAPVIIPYVPALFNQNERLVFKLTVQESQTLYLVMVGALNVGKITSPFWPNMHTNSGQKHRVKRDFEHAELVIGQELGTFHLGSTVVLVFDQELVACLPLKRADALGPIMLGQSLLTTPGPVR
jgi:phosphatidylserine decarboxylase